MATILLLGMAFLIGLGIYYVTNLGFELKERIFRNNTIRDAEYRVLEDEKNEKLKSGKD